jgi:hypothetical protein
MIDAQKNIEAQKDILLLEELFNEPHCESMHSDKRNQPCQHKVVATIVWGCGCSVGACQTQVSYTRSQMQSVTWGFCLMCNKTTAVSETNIIPRLT